MPSICPKCGGPKIEKAYLCKRCYHQLPKDRPIGFAQGGGGPTREDMSEMNFGSPQVSEVGCIIGGILLSIITFIGIAIYFWAGIIGTIVLIIILIGIIISAINKA